MGDYSGVPVRNVSLLEGIRKRAGAGVDIVYAKGVDLSLNGDTISLNNFQYIDPLVLPGHESNKRKIDSAVAVAASADIIICAVGQNEQFFDICPDNTRHFIAVEFNQRRLNLDFCHRIFQLITAARQELQFQCLPVGKCKPLLE